MKKFNVPEIEVVWFTVEDIITASNEFPINPAGIEDDLGIAKIQ